MAFPEALHERLYQKVAQEVFEAGAYLQICVNEEDGEYKFVAQARRLAERRRIVVAAPRDTMPRAAIPRLDRAVGPHALAVLSLC